MERYKVMIAHGETRSIFYVVDTAQPEAEQPAVVVSFGTDRDRFGAPASWMARDFCDRHNTKGGAQ